MTCFFLYHISWLVFDLFQSRMLVDHLPILESNFPDVSGFHKMPEIDRPFPHALLRLEKEPFWAPQTLPCRSAWVIGYPTKIYGIRHITSLNLFSITHFQPVFIGGFAHISAHCSLYSLDVWLVSSLNFPLQITILVINNPNSCISFKSPLCYSKLYFIFSWPKQNTPLYLFFWLVVVSHQLWLDDPPFWTMN